MPKRKDHHKRIIEAALKQLSDQFMVTQFHTAQKMPRKLRGVPDLHVLHKNVSWWIEIKPKYANYMRDQMSDLQWGWFHARHTVGAFGLHNKYTIVENESELVSALLRDWRWEVYLGEYHQGRYEDWRRGR